MPQIIPTATAVRMLDRTRAAIPRRLRHRVERHITPRMIPSSVEESAIVRLCHLAAGTLLGNLLRGKLGIVLLLARDAGVLDATASPGRLPALLTLASPKVSSHVTLP